MDVKELNVAEIGHEHPLTLVDLQQMHRDYLEDDDDFDENEMIAMQNFKCICNRCDVGIDWYHRYYYKCSISCNYNLHRFCAEVPPTLRFQDHSNHILILKKTRSYWTCRACHKDYQDAIGYHCSSCNYEIDLRCATFVEQKTIHHPSHPHPLICAFVDPISSKCFACGKKHDGEFYHCPTCFNFSIHSDCVSLPIKLLLQNRHFSHRHLLTLSYTFLDQLYRPECRICGKELKDQQLIYKCSKCMYYVHPDCATQSIEPFVSILLSGKIEKTFEDVDRPHLIHYPLPDESYNILSHQLIEDETAQFEKVYKDIHGNLVHYCQAGHRLVLIQDEINKDTTTASTSKSSVSLHDPMKRHKLLCNGCVRPITKKPFYKCSKDCNFVLHDWCTRLCEELHNHIGHPQHTLELVTDYISISGFRCDICLLPCNGFFYSCFDCQYSIDINCGFIPEEISHEAHPYHLLKRVEAASSSLECRACRETILKNMIYFRCTSCDFYLDYGCALLLPKTIRHKYDKQSLSLSYYPIEDHKSQYLCEICEKDLNPSKWFYHCLECAQSIHSAYAPLILQSEQGVNSFYLEGVYKYMNMKFGVVHKFKKYHQHPMSFVPGTNSDGFCAKCGSSLQSYLILKCLCCKFACHYYDCSTKLKPWSGNKQLDFFGGRHLKGARPRRRIIPIYPRQITRPVTRHWKVVDEEHP